MIFSVQLFTILALLGLAAANPIRRRSCTPNFQGNALTVNTSAAEWNAGNYQGGQITLTNEGSGNANQFLVEFTGQPTNAYHIK